MSNKTDTNGSREKCKSSDGFVHVTKCDFLKTSWATLRWEQNSSNSTKFVPLSTKQTFGGTGVKAADVPSNTKRLPVKSVHTWWCWTLQNNAAHRAKDGSDVLYHRFTAAELKTPTLDFSGEPDQPLQIRRQHAQSSLNVSRVQAPGRGRIEI